MTEEESTSLKKVSTAPVFSVIIESVWPEPNLFIKEIADSKSATIFTDKIGARYSVIQSSSEADFTSINSCVFLHPLISTPRSSSLDLIFGKTFAATSSDINKVSMVPQIP